MYLAGETDYVLHELRFDEEGNLEVDLVDDTQGQVLGFAGALRELALSHSWVWFTPQPVTQARLEPSSREVALTLHLSHSELRMEVNELQSRYRRLQVYERWMRPFEATDAVEGLPDHFHLRRLVANVPLLQVQLDVSVDGEPRTIRLGQVAAMDAQINGRNRDTFVNQVHLRPVRQDILSGLEQMATTLQTVSLAQRLRRLRQLRLSGPNLQLEIMVEP